MILADKIILLRKKNGWSQEELAEKMNVSRQSVSKWEGALSIPDLNKILQLSQIFGVSTDYLLKDELEESEYVEENNSPSEELPLRRVSMEEANAFLEAKTQTAPKIALATFLCILSPICLMFLGVASETGRLPITENMAGGIGMIVLLLLIASAVAIFISSGTKTASFEYLETTPIELEYGVAGMVKERKSKYQAAYTRNNIIGTCLCILSIVPLFASIIFTEDDFVTVTALSLTFLILGIAVVFFITAGIYWTSLQKLLEEGEYSKTSKKQKNLTRPISVIYWLTAVAVYLLVTYFFYGGEWDESWIVWPIAGVLYPVVLNVCRLIMRKKN